MAITPSQWSHVLTIPESYTPSAATSGQTFVITEGVIAKLSTADQNTFWNAVQNGGGDVRICTDSAGSNQLPVDLVSLDNVAKTCVIWTRKPAYDGAGELYVFIGKAGETQPAVTDPFGRNAVWVDEVVSFTGDSLADSTGNTTPTNNGATQITGPVGGAYDFDGVSNVIDFGNIASIGGRTTLVIAGWVSPELLEGEVTFASIWADTRAILFCTDNSDANEVRFAANSAPDGSGLFIEDSTSASLTVSNWQRVYAVFDASTGCTIYKNGVAVSSTQVRNVFSGGIFNASDSLLIGSRADGSDNNFEGGIAGFLLSYNSSGKYTSSYIATEYANQSDPATFYGTPIISLTSGDPEPETELHEFSGNAIVSALSFAQISKITQHNGQALNTASATASSTKAINVSGVATVVAQSVSLFEKRNTFSGNATVNATSQSSASKLVVFNGQAIVNVIASASLIDGNFEIHSFSGGALITASASGQAVKIGLVSGSANVTTSTSAQASKTAQLSGSATVSILTQSLFSKIAGISGNALTRVTTLASAFKRATLSGASRVFATVYGIFFNTESNVETYELTVQGRVKAPIVVQGRVKAPIVVQGRVKSLTIQGRVK